MSEDQETGEVLKINGHPVAGKKNALSWVLTQEGIVLTLEKAPRRKLFSSKTVAGGLQSITYVYWKDIAGGGLVVRPNPQYVLLLVFGILGLLFYILPGLIILLIASRYKQKKQVVLTVQTRTGGYFSHPVIALPCSDPTEVLSVCHDFLRTTGYAVAEKG